MKYIGDATNGNAGLEKCRPSVKHWAVTEGTMLWFRSLVVRITGLARTTVRALYALWSNGLREARWIVRLANTSYEDYVIYREAGYSRTFSLQTAYSIFAFCYTLGIKGGSVAGDGVP